MIEVLMILFVGGISSLIALALWMQNIAKRIVYDEETQQALNIALDEIEE